MFLKYILIIISITLFIIYLKRYLKEDDQELLEVKDVLLTTEELMNYGKELGRLHSIDRKEDVKELLLYRMNKNFKDIENIYLKFNKDINNNKSLPKASEWLLDNFYIIQLQYKRAKISLENQKDLNLNTLKSGPLKGYPRVYAIALELVAHSEGIVTEETLVSFINSYQKESILSIKEISSISLMLTIALLEYIKSICVVIEEIRDKWREAEKIDISNILEENIINDAFRFDASYIEYLLRQIKKERDDYTSIVNLVNKKLHYLGTDINSILEKEYGKQASLKISMGNGITSLKSISNLNWEDIFEKLCIVEKILREDPMNIYNSMDTESKNYYRYQIEKLAKTLNTEETYISSKALEFAKEKLDEGYKDKRCHVGYYIIDKGRDNIFESLGYNNKKAGLYFKNVSIYTFPIIFSTLIFVFLFSRYAYIRSNFLVSLIVAIVSFVPISSIVVHLVNFICSKIVNPVFLPKMEFKDGIPEDASTIVVIPTLLFSEERVEELCQSLETYYLANKEQHLYFAIVGDFKDGPNETEKEDKKIVRKALECIEKLNRKYSDTENIFYYFHRYRIYSDKEEKWMGWERKRGALVEFNNLILGEGNTTFNVISSDISTLKEKIKYVITLDGDTQLPMDTAKKMIGTIYHPLNRPYFDEDKGIVTEGYGLIQPRIIIDIEDCNKSLFTRIYAGQGGIDPYTTAVSDIYQDLFGEGIFTGKGIYQLDIFQKCLKDAIPENTILSHDLLEGSFVRVGLATDIELVDGYPGKYNSYIMRQHRWVRGDWQLIKWLKKRNNPLTRLSRWKILDNLRRSLVPVSLLLLIILGMFLFPGNIYIWLGLSLLAIFSPLLLSIFDLVFFADKNFDRLKLNGNIICGPKGSLYQGILYFIFLPYEGSMMIDAIIRTLHRVYVSKKNLLQWTTAFEVEKNLGNNLISYFIRMKNNIIISILTVIFTYYFRYENIAVAIVVGILWSLSPLVAYEISKDEVDRYELDEQSILNLRKIGRKTWDYYESYTDEENNFLPPDNYQEYPYNGVADRTSPTNIGFYFMAVLSARDFGYLTTSEMIRYTNRTLDTIEKMEKWKGNLYNWYNTRSLEPLRPFFVSTVDSGNFVSYLMVLKEGIKQYMNSPLLDESIIKGLKDTIELIENEEVKLLLNQNLNDTEDIYKEKLDKMVQKIESLVEEKKDKWVDNTIKQIEYLQKEYEKYFPDLETRNEIEKIYMKMDNSFSPIELKKYYNELLFLIEDKRLEENIIDLNTNINNLIGYMEETISKIEKIINETQFGALYDFKKDLFSIGYNVDEKKLLNSYYDLLASEARITSYIAVCRKEVPKKHWFRLGRPLVVSEGYRSLASWTGTMFEYLMPSLVMKNFKNSLLDETYKTVVKTQEDYCKEKNVPWGISESGFFAFDSNLNYQYKAFGVPYLGFKRGLKEDLVVSPYSTFLALPFNDTEKVLRNIERLKKEGLESEYGFYEAIDYTTKRLPINMDKGVVKSYMTHHQGMIIVAINNLLNENIMVERFHSYPEMKCGELLLQEKIPLNIVVKKEKDNFEDLRKERFRDDVLVVRSYDKNSLDILKCHILSSGDYSMMITNRGEGYSKKNDIFINRWRKDLIAKKYGMFIYIKDLKNNMYWSTTYEPTKKKPDDYRVEFSNDKVTFYRTDGDIETKMDIVLLSEEDGEIRKVTITNNSKEQVLIDVTSYFEIVADKYESDLAHPVFNNLFVRTEEAEEYEGILAQRRGREEDEQIWISHSVKEFGNEKVNFQYETDRGNFVGRVNDLSNPIALEKGLSNTTGLVLDPILSLNKRIKIDEGESKEVYFVTGISDSKKDAHKLMQKYQDKISFSRAFSLAYTRSQTEISYLNFKPSEIKVFDNMLSNILFLDTNNKSKYNNIIKDNIKGQEGLWAYGISGDLPIILVLIRTMEGIDFLKEILKAHEYWSFKGLKIDLVILNQDESAYFQPLLERINEIVYEYRGDVLERSGGVYIRSDNNMSYEDKALFYKWASLIIDSEEGLSKEETRTSIIPYKEFDVSPKVYSSVEPELDLINFNGYGGFSKDGKEYIIKLTKDLNTPLPWINVIANRNFGFIVSEQGSSFTWAHNSRENKLTPWFNDPIEDMSEEIIYIRDDQTGEVWTITPQPIRDDQTYVITHGLGYTHFHHNSKDIEQNLTMYTSLNDNIKINLMKLKNNSNFKRKLTIFYYVRPVLSAFDEETEKFIETEMNENEMFLAKNSTNTQFENSTLFLATSEKIKSYTGDRIEFLGRNSSFVYPEGIKREGLSNKVGIGFNPCCAIEIPISLDSGEEKEMVCLLGESRDIEKDSFWIEKYRDINYSKMALEKVREYWQNTLGKIQIKTPDPSMNLIMNYWLMYQTIVCRLWGRAAFYQVGGAFGARDQMQDVINSIYFVPDETKNQIINNCSHQYVEGDVQHWWHPILNSDVHKGIRSRCSDDLLWLVYGVSKYVKVTEDYDILHEKIPFIESDLFKDNEYERYEMPRLSGEIATVYEHCIRAIEKSLSFGEKRLPLIGTGDWNDGMNRVGYKGKGESIWLGWFLGTVLKEFIPICEKMKDYNKKNEYEKVVNDLKEAIEENGWDGEWYLRAYFDDGTPLGTKEANECTIDSIAQSWAVISRLGCEERARSGMEAVEKYLVDEEEGIIKLLSPPFDESEPNPGYIKGYVPGVRENGGQYTHAAAWVIKAFAMLGEGEKAHKLFNLINPINHTRTTIECANYKVEPYVMVADIYTTSSHLGRGGWSWYTGSSGWMYMVGLEDILGFKKEGKRLLINPCIPKEWESYSLKYNFMDTIYNIKIKNPHKVNTGVSYIKLDGNLLNAHYIPLVNDSEQHNVEVVLGNYTKRS